MIAAHPQWYVLDLIARINALYYVMDVQGDNTVALELKLVHLQLKQSGAIDNVLIAD